VESGDLLWSDRIDAEANDIIGVQDTITQEIVDGLRLELSPDEKDRLVQQPTANAEAYEEYLRGRDALGRFIYKTIARKDIDEAIEHFEHAAYLDPSFALAHSGLGKAYANRVIKGTGEPGDYDLATEAFDKALALDPGLLEPRRHMVLIYLSNGEKDRARETAERLVLELRDKVGKVVPDINTTALSGNSLQQDALNALIALGISKQQAETSIQKLNNTQPGINNLEELIKKALKSI